MGVPKTAKILPSLFLGLFRIFFDMIDIDIQFCNKV